MCQCVFRPNNTWGHSVEGQSASKPVQIHSYFLRASGQETFVCFSTVVTGTVTITMTFKTPGLVVGSKPVVIALSAPGDSSSVGHNYRNISFANYLPVTAASQNLSTQHLSQGIRSLWVIRILFNKRRLSVPRKRKSAVGRVWVQCEITGI